MGLFKFIWDKSWTEQDKRSWITMFPWMEYSHSNNGRYICFYGPADVLFASLPCGAITSLFFAKHWPWPFAHLPDGYTFYSVSQERIMDEMDEEAKRARLPGSKTGANWAAFPDHCWILCWSSTRLCWFIFQQRWMILMFSHRWTSSWLLM